MLKFWPFLQTLLQGQLNSRAQNLNGYFATQRIESGMVCPEPEIIAMGVDSSWQQVGQLNSRAQNLNGYFATQRIESGMYQLNSIATICRDNYSNQHGIQGLGQLNSITPIHDPHYMAPQRMNGMVWTLQNVYY
uniref:Protein FAR-RED ELONGATED HYPOCOTYL 3 n=1 Tax=Cajanus cajan TaxID=3821 RepID=A0A151S5L1_CAJCA|nr:Protein FAR-RED ELONGATED HYPOCOTYL 3 [Cajanus cajan]